MGQSRTEPQEAIRLMVFDDDYKVVGYVDLANVCESCSGWGKTIDVGQEKFGPCTGRCDDGLLLDEISGGAILRLLRHFGPERVNDGSEDGS